MDETMDTDVLKYNILDALRDLKTLASNDRYKDQINLLIGSLRKCKILPESELEYKITIGDSIWKQKMTFMLLKCLMR